MSGMVRAVNRPLKRWTMRTRRREIVRMVDGVGWNSCRRCCRSVCESGTTKVKRRLLDYGWNESFAGVKKRRIVLKLPLPGDKNGLPKREELVQAIRIRLRRGKGR